MFQILFCDDPGIVRVIYFIKVLLNLIRFIVPIGLIITISIDLYKSMLHGYLDNKENIIKKSGDRIIASIIVFLVPTLINLLFSLLSKVEINIDSYHTSFSTCYNEASLELIEALDEEKLLRLTKEEEEKRKKDAISVAKYKANLKAMAEANEKAKNDQSSNSSYSSNITNLNKIGSVYIKNGTFFIPNGPSGKNCPTNTNNKYGFNNYFWDMMSSFIEASKKAGYNLSFQKEGCRSYEKQVRFYNTMEKGRAARPGNSKHGWGIAADMIFYKDSKNQCGSKRTRQNCPGMAWAHDNAGRFGLKFPLINASYKEDWHMEPIKQQKY